MTDFIGYTIDFLEPTKYDWDKTNLAVVVQSDHDGIVLWYVGGYISNEIESVGNHLDDLGLDDAPEGISVWEGKYSYHSSSWEYYSEGFDSEPHGKFREPTEEEWKAIKRNECPWDPEDWLKQDALVKEKS